MIPKLAVDMKNGYRRQVKNRVIEGRTVNRQVSFGVSRGLFAPAKFLIDVINAYPVSLSLSLKKKKKKLQKKKRYGTAAKHTVLHIAANSLNLRNHCECEARVTRHTKRQRNPHHEMITKPKNN